MHRYRTREQGFALPTVVISSLILFMILVAAVGSATSVRVALEEQYYNHVARDTIETAAARSKECVLHGNMPISTNITPATNCSGVTVSGFSPYAQNGNGIRTSYIIRLVSSTAQQKRVSITATVDKLRTSTGLPSASYTQTATQQVSYTPDEVGDRASQRYWYFGSNVKFDFGATGSSMPVTSVGPLFGYEGTTVVTNQSGTFLFSSDGQTIWDKTNGVMSNGSGLNGASSATQAVVSFPMNQEQTRYGVVSNSAMAEDGYGPGELYLSVVDMTLNGGNGGVTTKNVKLGLPGFLDYSSEGVGSMPNNDGSGYWVYTYSAPAATITGFLIKLDGSVTGPVVTSLAGANAPMICTTKPSGLSGYGSINFNKNYSKMILLIGSVGCAASNGTAYIITPNSTTGTLAVNAKWTTANSVTPGEGYTADFSPSGNYVYVTQLYHGAMTRYNVSSGVGATIAGTQWNIGRTTNLADAGSMLNAGGMVKRGPDDRMYVADRAYRYSSVTPCRISYVSNPDDPTNSTSAIGWNLNGLVLPAGTCGWWGLAHTATVYIPKITTY